MMQGCDKVLRNTSDAQVFNQSKLFSKALEESDQGLLSTIDPNGRKCLRQVSANYFLCFIIFVYMRTCTSL